MTRKQWTDAIWMTTFGLVLVGVLYVLLCVLPVRAAVCCGLAPDGKTCTYLVAAETCPPVTLPVAPTPTVLSDQYIKQLGHIEGCSYAAARGESPKECVGVLPPEVQPRSLSKREEVAPTPPDPTPIGTLRVLGDFDVQPGELVSIQIAVKRLTMPLTLLSVWVDVPAVVTGRKILPAPVQSTVHQGPEEDGVLSNGQVRVVLMDMLGRPVLDPGTSMVAVITGVVSADAVPGDYSIRASVQQASNGPLRAVILPVTAVLHVHKEGA